MPPTSLQRAAPDRSFNRSGCDLPLLVDECWWWFLGARLPNVLGIIIIQNGNPHYSHTEHFRLMVSRCFKRLLRGTEKNLNKPTNQALMIDSPCKVTTTIWFCWIHQPVLGNAPSSSYLFLTLHRWWSAAQDLGVKLGCLSKCLRCLRSWSKIL